MSKRGTSFATPKKNENQAKDAQPSPEEPKVGIEIPENHREEEDKEEMKPKVILNDFITVPVDDDKESEEIKKELRFEISTQRDSNKLVQKIFISIYDNEDIFFCMKTEYDPEDFNELKEYRYYIPFEGIAREVIDILRAIKAQDPQYSIKLTIRGTQGLLTISQTTKLITKELISFNFESISEEEADELAQSAYLRISARLELAQKKLAVYNRKLRKMNPDIYDDILVNGQDYAHSHEEKKRSLEQFLETNQKVSAGIAQMQQMNQMMPSPR